MVVRFKVQLHVADRRYPSNCCLCATFCSDLLKHRFPTFVEVGTPFIKLSDVRTPSYQQSGGMPKKSGSAASSFFKLLLVIYLPSDNATENTQLYCLTFLPYWSLEKKPGGIFITASLKLSAHILAHNYSVPRAIL